MYEAWVSATSNKPLSSPTLAPDAARTGGTFNKLRDTLSKSPLLGRKQIKSSQSTEQNNGAPVINLSRRNSRSLSDLTTLYKSSGNSNLPRPNSDNVDGSCFLSMSAGHDTLSQKAGSFTGLDNSMNEPPPEINKITPNIVPVKGGTKLCIEGHHLGKQKTDIIGLYVCGANCLKTLEYESDSVLYCTTKEWKVCTGYIVIETLSGGKAKSKVTLTFTEDVKPVVPNSLSVDQPQVVRSAPTSPSHQGRKVSKYWMHINLQFKLD